MNTTPQAIRSPHQFLQFALRHPARWLIPALATALAVGVWAFVRQPPWEASQALVIRNDAAANQESPGKFSQPDEMKDAQETILELVRSHSVLKAALEEVGPPDGAVERVSRPVPDGSEEASYAPAGHALRKASGRATPSAWPSEEDIAELREAVKLAPPKGAEFGKTEVFYLKVRDRRRERAVALVSALCRHLESRYQKLRDAKAASVVGELEKAAELAARDLRESTGRLSGLERQVGSDLGELRILQDSAYGESTLRHTITEIQTELRQVHSARESNEELLALLKLAQAQPDRLVAMPNTLLQSQPGLRRLKDGWIDAQLATSHLLGRMSAEHPLVKAARQSQQQIVRDVHDEVANAIRAVEVDLRVSRDRAALLDEQLAAATARLQKLASLRAPYANQVAETKKRVELMERAEQRLADARAGQATAKTASLLARIDAPETGARPVGPSRATLLAAGLIGGLVIGLGVLFFSVENGGSPTAFEERGLGGAVGRVSRPVSDGSEEPSYVPAGRAARKTSERPARPGSFAAALQQLSATGA